MIRVWTTAKLADDIASNRVTPDEKLVYFAFAQVLYIAIGYIAGYGPSHGAWMYIYEAVLVGVVTYAGTRKVASAYGAPVDSHFFETVYLLTIPLTVKTTLAMWLLDYSTWYAIDVIVARAHPETATSADAMSYWLSRGYVLIPFVVAVAIAMVFWYRLAHHVNYVVRKRMG